MRYDYPLFRERCELPMESFAHMGQLTTTDNGRHIFIDRGAPILAVAHMDSVSLPAHFAVDDKMGVVYCPTLDDRLGVHIILDILPTMGVVCDVLLTENEERCCSTAAEFIPPVGKTYNWVFSFDRAGSDVVTYQCGGKAWGKALRRAGWKIGQGSYSCIAELSSLGCCGANFGTSYHDHHTHGANCSLHELGANLVRFGGFYRAVGGRRFAHVAPPRDEFRNLFYEPLDQSFSRAKAFDDDDLQYDPHYPCGWCGLNFSRDGLSRHGTSYICDNCHKELNDLRYRPSKSTL